MQIAAATRTDPLLSLVLSYVKKGWPKTVSQDLKPYFHRRQKLTAQNDCVMWGIRVVVPAKFHDKAFAELHQDHPGICRMKSIGRSYVWWPNFDNDIEKLVKSCGACLSVKLSPSKAPLNPRLWHTKPWSRIHINFMGPLFGKSYIVIVDAHFK